MRYDERLDRFRDSSDLLSGEGGGAIMSCDKVCGHLGGNTVTLLGVHPPTSNHSKCVGKSAENGKNNDLSHEATHVNNVNSMSTSENISIL